MHDQFSSMYVAGADLGGIHSILFRHGSQCVKWNPFMVNWMPDPIGCHWNVSDSWFRLHSDHHVSIHSGTHYGLVVVEFVCHLFSGDNGIWLSVKFMWQMQSSVTRFWVSVDFECHPILSDHQIQVSVILHVHLNRGITWQGLGQCGLLWTVFEIGSQTNPMCNACRNAEKWRTYLEIRLTTAWFAVVYVYPSSDWEMAWDCGWGEERPNASVMN
jgi:hypothetical protein